jgi:hypothetical protein
MLEEEDAKKEIEAKARQTMKVCSLWYQYLTLLCLVKNLLE